MKKFVAIILILAVAISGLLFVSCKKEEKKVEEKKVEEKKVEKKKYPVEEKKVEKKKGEYEPRTTDEAIAEWVDFRKNEKARIGIITTWRFKIAYISSESPIGYLGQGSDKKVVIVGPSGFTYLAASAIGKVPVVKEDDTVCVTGRFEGVSSDGLVILSPIKVINEGYQ